MRNILSLPSFKEVEKSPINPSHPALQSNYLLGLSMLYMMFMILSGLTVYKLVDIGWIVIPAGLLVTPFTYSISNIISEVYGYAVSRNMMWWFLFTSSVFTIFGFALSNLPSPSYFDHQDAFSLLLGSLPIVFIAGSIGTLLGISFNNYLVSKTKVIMGGKKYWVRSILSTAGGEVMYNIIAYPIMWFGRIPNSKFFHLLICATLFKILITAIVWPFECLFANALKVKDKTDVFDYGINYNIFIFGINSARKEPRLS